MSGGIVSLARAFVAARGGAGSLPLSAEYSSFVVTPAAFDADGVVAADVDITAKDTANAVIVGLSGTATATAQLVDAADSTVVASPGTIADDGVESSTITMQILNTAGRGVWGIPAARVVLSLVSGTGTLTQPSGATNYDGVITGSLVSSTAGTCVVRATVLGLAITQEPSITVTGSPPPAGLEMDSLWDFTTGPTDAAIEDDGEWDPSFTSNNSGTREGLTVAVASGTDPFVTNALEVRYRTASSGFAFIRQIGLAVPDVGESKWYRWGFRQRFTEDQVANTPHPIQDAQAQGGTNWMFMIPPATVTATTWRPEYRTAALSNPGHYQWLGPVLDIGTWYLFEHQVERTGTTTWNLHVRVRNTAGTLIAEDVDFVNMADAGESLADDPTLTFHDVANLAGINGGCNGITPGTSPIGDEGALFDQACLATSNDNWIGVP